MQSLVYGLGSVSPTLGLELHELAVDLVHVIGQIKGLGDVLVATVTVPDQTELDVRSGLG